MEGAALRQEREYNHTLAASWHTANFNAAAQNGKLRGLSKYLIKKGGDGSAPTWAKAHAFFSGLKAKGLDVKIERVVH